MEVFALLKTLLWRGGSIPEFEFGAGNIATTRKHKKLVPSVTKWLKLLSRGNLNLGIKANHCPVVLL